MKAVKLLGYSVAGAAAAGVVVLGFGRLAVQLWGEVGRTVSLGANIGLLGALAYLLYREVRR